MVDRILEGKTGIAHSDRWRITNYSLVASVWRIAKRELRIANCELCFRSINLNYLTERQFEWRLCDWCRPGRGKVVDWRPVGNQLHKSNNRNAQPFVGVVFNGGAIDCRGIRGGPQRNAETVNH